MPSEKPISRKHSGKAGMPYAETLLAKYISEQIDIQAGRGKNQRQIAREIGYAMPNMVSMFKRGEARVPLGKIPSLAAALNINPAHLFRLAIQQYWPDLGKTVGEIFGTVLTRNETKMVELIRHTTKCTDPILTDDLECKLKAAFDVAG
jgi:transcriptional regulator with XRE-family HTH domain